MGRRFALEQQSVNGLSCDGFGAARRRTHGAATLLAKATLWAMASLWATAGGAGGCGQIETAPETTTGTTAAGPDHSGEIVVIEQRATSEPDSVPRLELARRNQDGSLSSISGEYVEAVEFRAGKAAVTTDRTLELVHRDGSKSILAREVDGLPARAPDGSLVYAVRFGAVVEVHQLEAGGQDRRLASFHGSATRLAPQSDGSVVFVGSETGGVSGVWIKLVRG